MTVSYIHVFGYYREPDGVTPKAGYIEFSPSSILSSPDTGIIPIATVRAELDENGRFDVDLMATNTIGMVPVGWMWMVDEKIKNPSPPWFFGLDVAGPNPIDLSGMIVLPPTDPPSYGTASSGVGPNMITGITTTGEPGTLADSDVRKTAPNTFALDVTIPRGSAGATGPANALSVSGTVTGPPGSNADVQISGTAPAQSLAFTIPRGDTGSKGDTGVGVIPGGTTGQVLSKKTNTDYDMQWSSAGAGLDIATADARYVNVDGDSAMTGVFAIANPNRLQIPLTINRTDPAQTTSDAETFLVNYMTKRATWTNEKGNLRTSNDASPAEVAFKVIGSSTISGDYIEAVNSVGTILWRIGPNGRAIANAGMRMVGDTFQIQDSTAVDQSTIAQVTGGDLVITPKNNLSVASKKITALLDGTANTDAVNVGQMNTALSNKVAKAGDTMTGSLTLNGDGNVFVAPTVGGGGGNVYLDGPTPTIQVRGVRVRTAGVLRWIFGGTSDAESGANAGSDFFIQAYTDAGGGLGRALTVKRDTQQTIFNQQPTAATPLTEADIAPASGWGHYGSTYGNVKVTRFGPVVTLQGMIKRTGADLAVTASGWITVGTVPDNFRPDVIVYGTGNSTINSTSPVRTSVSTDGTVQVAYMAAGTVTTNAWVVINMSWRAA